MEERYIVMGRPDGWWDIRDTRSSQYWGEDNLAVASFSGAHFPNAEQTAREVCDKANGKQ